MTPINPLLQKDPKSGLRPAEFYFRCMMGGFAACGITHAGVVTLDVAKVRTQAHSKAGNWPSGLIPSVQKTWQQEGWAGITKGWHPTFWGYGLQGLFKFGLNEFFKDLYTNIIGEEKSNPLSLHECPCGQSHLDPPKFLRTWRSARLRWPRSKCR